MTENATTILEKLERYGIKLDDPQLREILKSDDDDTEARIDEFIREKVQASYTRKGEQEEEQPDISGINDSRELYNMSLKQTSRRNSDDETPNDISDIEDSGELYKLAWKQMNRR